MVRTKASASTASVRVSAAKAPRKSAGGSSRPSVAFSSPTGKKDKSIGGNPACPRSTPEWQKPIGAFFNAVSQENKADKAEEERPAEPATKETPAHFHDDKENRDPDIEEAGPSCPTEDQPGPSTSSATKAKRKRIVLIEDSDDDEEPSTSGAAEPPEEVIITAS